MDKEDSEVVLKGYTYLGQIDASRNSHRMRRYDNDIRNCVDVCVDMLVEGKLGPVNTGVHKMIINRWRGCPALKEISLIPIIV